MTKTNPTPTASRDEVLFAFHQACERPTADEIIDWTERFPHFAEDIRAHAAVSRDWAARGSEAVEEPNEAMLANAYSRALNALYNAEVEAASAGAVLPAESFQQMLAERGEDVPSLARALNIARSVLADLFNGGMLAPVGKRLMDAIVGRVTRTRKAFDDALMIALASPRLGHAKSKAPPGIIPRRYEDIIRDSDMPEERKRYWLAEDS